ncbi:MAG: tetratricopeptide repeat protein [Desulfobacterales bacterium]|nr:MAG: tetratricopeptide repeat protein [Desulfobacterales bacterium]
MAEERARRKLSGILSADAVGYSRLMQEDEASTIRNLEDSKRLMSELIEQFKGRVVDAPGDNLLAEFGSVVDATECAVKIQQELKDKNAELPDNRKMEFRIGVNLGDVVEEADRIYGDGINIAARIEGLAEPGGICISRTAFDHVKNKLELGYEYLGEHSVKNIAEPVRVYRVLTEPEVAGKVLGEKRFLGRISRKVAMVAVIILVIVAGALVGWNIYLQQSKKIEPASLDKMAYPLPDKPSIAVLPFDNISGNPNQEFLCDGMSEEIITALSKVPYLLVIARDSTFSYKGKPVKIRQVAENLGVRYVLEGSFRKAGDRVRITAQLIDAITGHHLWAERYERELKDMFALQDEITIKIITELQVKLTEAEQARLLAKGTDNLEAYLKLLQGREHHYRFNKENNVLARDIFQKAIALDPEYPKPYAFLATTHLVDIWLGSSQSPTESLAKAFQLAQKAIALDDAYATAHGLLGNLYMYTRQYDKAIVECERGVALDPNSANALAWLGTNLYWSDRPDQAIPLLKKAIRLNPFPPSWYLSNLAMAYRDTGRYEKAISACKKVLHRESKDVITRTILTATYSYSGREEEARAEAEEIFRIDPNFSLESMAKARPHKNPDNTKRFIGALRKAGLK